MTPDDVGGKVGGPQRPRARQNVVFELGFLIGKLGLSHVGALVKGDVERPSDFEGVAYITDGLEVSTRPRTGPCQSSIQSFEGFYRVIARAASRPTRLIVSPSPKC
jgi:hypothetical protein